MAGALPVSTADAVRLAAAAAAAGQCGAPERDDPQDPSQLCTGPAQCDMWLQRHVPDAIPSSHCPMRHVPDAIPSSHCPMRHMPHANPSSHSRFARPIPPPCLSLQVLQAFAGYEYVRWPPLFSTFLRLLNVSIQLDFLPLECFLPHRIVSHAGLQLHPQIAFRPPSDRVQTALRSRLGCARVALRLRADRAQFAPSLLSDLAQMMPIRALPTLPSTALACTLAGFLHVASHDSAHPICMLGAPVRLCRHRVAAYTSSVRPAPRLIRLL